MGENDQKSVNGYVLFRVGGEEIQCVPVVFFLVNTQYSFPRVMFQAKKMCRRGTGHTHGHARMGKNDDSPKRLLSVDGGWKGGLKCASSIFLGQNIRFYPQSNVTGQKKCINGVHGSPIVMQE